MKQHKYYTQNDDYEWEEIDQNIANEVIRQYVEKRYIGVLVLSSFVVGFLLGVIAYAI